MRLIAVLLGPALVAVALMEGLARFVPPTEVSVEQPALEWSGRLFTSEEQFAGWLASRGGSYERWRARHPESPWRSRPAPVATSDISLGPVRRFALALVVGGLASAAALALMRRARRYPGAGGRMRARTARLGRRAASTAVLLAAGLASDVVRGAVFLARALGAGVGTLRRATGRAAHGVRLVAVAAPTFGSRIGTALATVLVVADAGSRRLAQVAGVTSELSNRVDPLTRARAARAALAFGAIAAVSGALGVTIAIVFQ